ncbi:hypothetical protein F0224_16740 [Vibrio coralliilyticus]|uniref:hypothetical protein n=1 Tax=Vibrio coralliilyticus TaxID=190893 RepID=UPI000BAC279B|nr:hypothetical protein [Vibrio coralliilyticus]NOI77336.1 hypothetical protein [Vibrio coralliilyticus]PAW02849.1 hypothetical protein CKJ79_14240 [Vibrio coralliilyticus]
MSAIENATSEVIKTGLSDLFKENQVDSNERSWLMDYLYKYSHLSGNCLPRGKFFDRVRDIESSSQWNKELVTIKEVLINKGIYNQFSPYLVSQMRLIKAASLEQITPFFLDTDLIVDTVVNIEEGNPSLNKHNIAFRRGVLMPYTHHHVPLLPDTYVKLLSKSKSINILSHNIDKSTGKLDFNFFDTSVKQKSASAKGRETGHWLISKQINGINYYLGFFPHGIAGGHDEKWIYSCLKESEVSLNKFKKRL